MKHLLYLHGFASGPSSYKGLAFDARFGRNYRIERLDLRLPNRDQLRVSAMIEAVKTHVDALEGDVAIVGSSLGGLVAAHVAAQRPQIKGLVLLAPAFRFAKRWAASFGTAIFERWKTGEPVEIDDGAGGPPLMVDFGFYLDACEVDSVYPAIDCPALVLHGKSDVTVQIEGSRTFVERSSRARLVELDDDHALIESLPTLLSETERFFEHLEWSTA